MITGFPWTVVTSSKGKNPNKSKEGTGSKDTGSSSAADVDDDPVVLTMTAIPQWYTLIVARSTTCEFPGFWSRMTLTSRCLRISRQSPMQSLIAHYLNIPLSSPCKWPPIYTSFVHLYWSLQRWRSFWGHCGCQGRIQIRKLGQNGLQYPNGQEAHDNHL